MKFKTALFLLSFLIGAKLACADAPLNYIYRFGFNYLPSAVGIDNPAGVLPFSDISKLITLHADVNSSTAGNYYVLTKMQSPTGTTQYQVPNGKTFVAYGIYVYTSNAQSCVLPGYGTAALGSDNTSTPPTGSVPYSGSSFLCGMRSDVGGATRFLQTPISFPQNSYPYMIFQSGSTSYDIDIIGREI